MRYTIKLICAAVVTGILILLPCNGQQTRKITILETTDVHGMVLPYDYIEKKESKTSLSGVESYIRKSGLKQGEMVLLDDGDNLQGQPTEYYYNFIDTLSGHINSAVMNYMHYDAATVGNHDLETGHRVYDRLRKEYRFPMLAANAVYKSSGKPYFEPYVIIKRNGLKIAVMGLVTPAIPDWLPPELYSGMEFEDMVQAAKKWMTAILAQKPDLVIGLFHSGWDKNFDPAGSGNRRENGSAAVAYNVPGFDVIFAGHDHGTACEKIVNRQGDSVLVIDGGSHAEKIGRADITVIRGSKSRNRLIHSTGSLLNVKDYSTDNEYDTFFSSYNKTVRNYVDKVIGKSASSVSSRDSYFGPSSFTDMIHEIQLDISGADISFAAPLSFDVEIPEGKITVGDMFKLYRFENMLYTMTLTGNEILKYLEFSYGGWFNTMKDKEDNMLAFRSDQDGKPVITGGRARLKTQPYNFDSAAGIDYTVDVSKPAGSRVTISGMSNGKPFDLNARYTVAVNSYRGNGGGGHLFEGAGISRDELRSRLVRSTDRDLRYFILRYIEKTGVISPQPGKNWKVIPSDWVENAKKTDYKLLFGNAGRKDRN